MSGPLDNALLASPILHVSTEAPPVLIMHSSEDPIAPVEQATVLDETLCASGVESTPLAVYGSDMDSRAPNRSESRRSSIDSRSPCQATRHESTSHILRSCGFLVSRVSFAFRAGRNSLSSHSKEESHVSPYYRDQESVSQRCYHPIPSGDRRSSRDVPSL